MQRQPGAVADETTVVKRTQDRASLVWFCDTSPSTSSVQVHHSVVQPVNVDRDLGVWIDMSCQLHENVSRVVQAVFYRLRSVRSVRRQRGRDVCMTDLSFYAIAT